MKLLIILLPVFGLTHSEDIVRTSRDSYLKAYKDINGVMLLDNTNKSKINREFNAGYSSEQYPPGYYPASRPTASGVYPTPQYGPPPPSYGPPTAPISYPQYGVPSYVPFPSYAPNYGPPRHPKPYQGTPYAAAAIGGILDKIKWKLDLFTIGKILLKLVIFKKIVGLIAILCLLLFIPSLKHKHFFSSSSPHEEDEDMVRSKSRQAKKLGNGVNNLATNVFEALENHPKKYPPL